METPICCKDLIIPGERYRTVHVRAYTLTEVLITMAIAVILLGTAVPPLHNMVMDNRLVVAVNQLHSDIYLARSEAVKRAKRLVLCPRADDNKCAEDGRWHLGWILFVDSNNNRDIDEGEYLVRLHHGADGTLTITSGLRRKILFQPLGSTLGSTATFTFCDGRGASKARALILSNSGRLRASRTQANGNDLICS